MLAPRRTAREREAEPQAAGEARALLALLAECAAAAAERSALRLRLSRLPRSRAEPRHLRLARAALDPLGRADRARTFRLDNNDVVAIWRGEADELVAACRADLAHLFAADADEPAPDAADLVELLRLPRDARALLRIVEASLAPPPRTLAPNGLAPRPLDLASLANLEERLLHADLASFARRRSVCALRPDGAMELAWERRLFSIDELGAVLAPDRAPRADPWLFRRLTRTLDGRMLALLRDPEELRFAGPFSLALNVGSLLSPEFLRFDASLPTRLRGEVTLELLPHDVMADPAAFLFAREFLRERHYRLQLNGLTPELMRMFPARSVGVDFLQLRWTSSLPAEAAAFAEVDPAQLVLTKAHTRAAIDWARTRGVGYCQGDAARPGGGG